MKQPDYEQGMVGTPAGRLGDSLKQENILLLRMKRPIFQELTKFVEKNQYPGPALSFDYLSAGVASSSMTVASGIAELSRFDSAASIS